MDVTAYKAPRWFEKESSVVREVPDSISGKAQPVTDHVGRVFASHFVASKQQANDLSCTTEDRDKFKPKLLLLCARSGALQHDRWT
uniref:Uncharacterized protein n=1 Tax=Peronospora matthiolae TaxID=2874970 RepID=A0AAV1VA41_9STRA